MRRTGILLTSLCAVSVMPTAAHACVGAAKLKISRPSPGIALLSWQGQAGTWRVQRSGRTVGHTGHHSVRVRVSPGRRTTFSVSRISGGRAGCKRRMAVVVPWLPFGAPTGLTLTQVSSTGATVTWRAGRRGDGRLAGYRVYRDRRALGQVKATHMRLGALPGRGNRLEVAAVDTHGHESRRSRIARPQASHRAPLAPGAVRASQLTVRSAVLSWKQARRGSAAVIAYRVYRDGVLARVTTARRLRVKLDPGHLRRFRISAVDALGYESDPSMPIAVAGLDDTPGPPVNLTVEALTDTSATISWSPSYAAGGAPRSYRVYRDDMTVGHSTHPRVTLKLVSGRTYRVTVAALGSGGRRSPRSGQLALSTAHRPPAAPVDLLATVASGGQATVSWQPAASGSAPVARYRVYRDGALVGVTGSLQATVGVPPGATRTVTVRSQDTRGYLSEPASVPVSATYHAPGVPAGLTISDLSDSAVTLSWSPAAQGSAPLRGYRIYRDGAVVGQVQGTTIRLGNLFASRRYVFQVAAADTRGVLGEPSAPLESTTALPPQTTGTAYAFLLASTDSSFHDFRAHYRQVGTVVPTYFDCTVDGRIAGRDDPLVTGWAQLRGVRVEPRVNCQDTARLHLLLTNPAVRQAALDRIVALAEHYAYDGINVDFEAGAAGDRDALSSFVRELSGRLHALGKTISIDVSAKTRDVPNHPRSTFFDYQALTAVCDRVVIMAWGLHWATSAPGAQDPIAWVRDVVSYAMSLPAENRARFVLGVQLYAMDWMDGGGPSLKADTYDYATAMERARAHGVEPVLDPATDSWRLTYEEGGHQHEAWFPDVQTFRNRLQLAADNGMPIALWRLGQEDQRIWAERLLGAA